MSGGIGRAAVIGAVLALLAVVATVAAIAGAYFLRESSQPVSTVLVIITARGAEGGRTAPGAFVVTSDGKASVLNCLAPVDVPGTTARTAREAYPFGGGTAVSQALAPQTGGRALEWVALPPDAWAEMVDVVGGVTVEVTQSVSVYAEGELTVLEPGTQSLTGAEAVSLASSIDFLHDPGEQPDVMNRIVNVVAEAILRDGALRSAVQSGKASSSVRAERIPVVLDRQ